MAKKTYELVGWKDESTGETPVNAKNLEHMDSAIKNLYDEGATSKDIFICKDEETKNNAPEEAKIVIESNKMYYRDEIGEWKELILEPSGDTLPVGFVMAFANETAPEDWLRCDGQEVSRTEYSELFEVIGTTFGSGDDDTTFNLPNINLENRTIVGSSGDGEFTLGKTMGEKTHTLQHYELPGMFWHTAQQDRDTINLAFSNTPGGSGMHASEAPSTSHNNMQPSIALNWCIKAKRSVGSDVSNISKDYIDEKNIYSIDEVVVGTYLGKPLYRKVLKGTLQTGSGENIFDIENAEINKIDGMIQSQEKNWFSLNCCHAKESDYAVDAYINSNRNGFTLICGSSYDTSSSYEITVEYTKTEVVK